jgi:WD40 repeat protein
MYKIISEIPILDSSVSELKFSPKNDYLVIGSREIKVWDLKKKEIIKSLFDELVFPYCFEFDNMGYLIVGGDSGREYSTIKFWDIGDGKIFKEISPETINNYYCVDDLAFSPDFKFLAFINESVFIWDLKKEKYFRTIKTRSSIREISYSKDSKFIAFASGDGTSPSGAIDISNGKIIELLKFEECNSVSFNNEGNELAFAYAGGGLDGIYPEDKGKIISFKYKTGQFEKVMSYENSENMLKLVFSSNDKQLFAIGPKTLPKIWDTKNKKLIYETGSLEEFKDIYPDYGSTIACSNDGKYLAFSANEQKITKIFILELL